MKGTRFTGKVVIVTGGGSGLGRTCCRAFAGEGAAVVSSDIDFNGAKETVTEITGAGGRALAVKTDVSKADEVEKLTEETLNAYHKIDILVNNAGIIVRQGLLDTTEDIWDREVGVDLKGTFLVTKAVIPHMIERKYGKVVNVASIAGLTGLSSTAYTAAKAGVLGMTRIWAMDFAHYHICVNAVAPGFIATPISAKMRATSVGKIIDSKIPLGYGTPDSVAPAILFLSSCESDYITGQCLVVDGGLSCCHDLGPEFRFFDRGKSCK